MSDHDKNKSELSTATYNMQQYMQPDDCDVMRINTVIVGVHSMEQFPHKPPHKWIDCLITLCSRLGCTGTDLDDGGGSCSHKLLLHHTPSYCWFLKLYMLQPVVFYQLNGAIVPLAHVVVTTS